MLIETAAGLFCPAGRISHRPVGPGGPGADHPRAWRPCAARQRRLSLRRRRARRCCGAASAADAAIETAALRRVADDRRRRGSASIRPATCSDPRRLRIEGGATASGSSAATTSAPPIRPARRSSRCAATRSSPSPRSGCRSTAGIRPTAVIADIIGWWQRERREAGRTSVLFCYTLGKAQRLLAELARADRPARCSCTA